VIYEKRMGQCLKGNGRGLIELLSWNFFGGYKKKTQKRAVKPARGRDLNRGKRKI
jgi:hypothetical protein